MHFQAQLTRRSVRGGRIPSRSETIVASASPVCTHHRGRSHAIWGLSIASTFPLVPGAAAQGPADVVVRRGRVRRSPTLPPLIESQKVFVGGTEEQTVMSWDDVGTCVIRGGWDIVVQRAPQASERTIRNFVLGQGLGIALLQRRALALHGSAVATPRGAVVFLGTNGSGKSTTAAAFLSEGTAVLADDLVVIDVRTRPPSVPAGSPVLRLSRDAAASVERPGSRMPWRRMPGEDTRGKCSFRVHRSRSPRVTVPLRCIYVLADGRVEAIEPLTPTAAFFALLRNVYMESMIRGSASRWVMETCAALARVVPVRTLQRRKIPEALPRVVRMVREEIHSSHCRLDAPAAVRS